MRRLFSTFASGLPGAGLLVMRVVAGTALVVRGISALQGGLTIGSAALLSFQFVLAALLLAGFWTPVAGTLVAITELARVVLQPDDLWVHLLLATLGVALALLGPGIWSVDARLFGWRRINIRDRQSRPHTFRG